MKKSIYLLPILLLHLSLFGQPTNDTCEGAETFLSETPIDCSFPNIFIDIEGSLEDANPDVIQGGCQQDMGPTVWFKIKVDTDDATKLVTQVIADGFDVVWAVYKGGNCDSINIVNEQLVVDEVTETYPCSNSDGDPSNIFQTAIETNSASDSIYYWVSVTAVGEIDDPNFTLTFASALPCLACSGDDAFDCDNGDFDAYVNGVIVEQADYKYFHQGETVEVCISFNYNTTGSSNDWFHGFVPTFGRGWDIEASDLESQSIGGNFEYFDSDGGCGAYLNGYDMPNICTYMEDGILKLCNEACNPGGCPCSGGMEAGDPLPSGWWVNSAGGSPSCDSTCSPSVHFGWPSGTNVNVNFCLDLVVKEFESQEEYEQNKDLRIIVQTFSDAISGCWDDGNPCLIDPSIQGPGWEVNCSNSPKAIFSSNHVEICTGDSFLMDVITSDSSGLEITIEAEDNLNVNGEMDVVILGSGEFSNTLTNLSDTIEIVNYYATVGNEEEGCLGRISTFQVEVYPDLTIEIEGPMEVCGDADEEIQLCVDATDEEGLYLYEWNTGETSRCILVQPSYTYSYCVTVTDNIGCVVEECNELIVNPIIVTSFNQNDLVICQNEGGQVGIELSIMGGVPPFIKEWYFSDGLVGETSMDESEFLIDITNSLNIGSPHLIYVQITDVMGCMEIASTTLELIDSPILTTEVLSLPSSGSSGDVELLVSTVPGINGNLVNSVSIFDCDGVLLEQILNSSNDTITVTASDCYYIEAEDTGGCIAFDTLSGVLATAYIEGDRQEMIVFPNPTSDIFTIELLESRSKKVELSIYSLTGKRMMVKEKQLDNGKLNVDLSNCVKGVYLLKVELDNKSFIQRVILL